MAAFESFSARDVRDGPCSVGELWGLGARQWSFPGREREEGYVHAVLLLCDFVCGRGGTAGVLCD